MFLSALGVFAYFASLREKISRKDAKYAKAQRWLNEFNF